jgi:hypothetical protein
VECSHLSHLSQGLATLADVPLTKAGLAAWMRTQQQRGLKPGGINMYARSANSFLTWANAEGLLPERLQIRLLPDPPKPSPQSRTPRFDGSSFFGRMAACRCERGPW